MSILYYTDIYAFPGGYPSRKPPMKPEIMPSYAFDTSKSVDIVDAFNNVRYVVQLSSQLSSIEISGAMVESRVFQTTVSQMLSSGLSAFLTVPEEGHEADYGKAMHDFNTCVQRYSSLVWAENKDFNSIDIYKEAIGYEVLVPSCCMNCRWSQDAAMPGHGPIGKHLECHSPKNQQVFVYEKAFPSLPNPKLDQWNGGWKKLPWQKCVPDYGPIPPHECMLGKIFPTVDPLGKCDNYEKKDAAH